MEMSAILFNPDVLRPCHSGKALAIHAELDTQRFATAKPSARDEPNAAQGDVLNRDGEDLLGVTERRALRREVAKPPRRQTPVNLASRKWRDVNVGSAAGEF